jgi:hypothetical protein
MPTDAYLNFYTDIYGSTNRITFIGPTVDAHWDTGEFVTTLFSEGARGKTVLITDGVATEKRYVTQTQLREADYYFLGGHDHVCTEAEGQALVDAGYTPAVIEEA